jgi:hypothetical protein
VWDSHVYEREGKCRLNNLSKGGFERRVPVGEIASQSSKKVMNFVFRLLLPQKNEGRRKTAHLIETTRDLVCDRRLSSARLSEQDKSRLGAGVVHPTNNEVQESCARSRKAAFLRHEARARPIRYFSDFASSSVTIIRSVTLKLSGIHTSVQNVVRYPLQLGSDPVKLTRYRTNVG